MPREKREMTTQAKSMAGNSGSDPQRQFLTLIRNFATEKSQGERRIVDLKKQTEDIRLEFETANSELSDVKRAKEMIEQDLKGYEVELALSETSMQGLKSRISLIQDEISNVGSDSDAHKKEEGALRDEFLKQMIELNAEIRKFQETTTCSFQKEFSLGNGSQKSEGKELNESSSKVLEDRIGHVISQITLKEEEFHSEQKIQKQTQQEFIDSERKISLIEVIVKTTRALEVMTGQTSELEKVCASVGEDLQRRCICPNCHQDNTEVLGELLQPNGAN